MFIDVGRVTGECGVLSNKNVCVTNCKTWPNGIVETIGNTCLSTNNVQRKYENCKKENLITSDFSNAPFEIGEQCQWLV